MLKFADLETENAIKTSFAFSGQESLPIGESTKENLDDFGSAVIKRLYWYHPPDNAFSEDGQKKLANLRGRCNVNHIWNWINGHRTVKEIYDRVQFNNPITYDVLKEYLNLLLSENFVKFNGTLAK
jgi:hypothetical protein